MGKASFTNWSGVQHCQPAWIIQPHSEAELRQALQEARRRDLKVKVVGAGHSWTDAACTDGFLINLDHMKRVLAIDHANAQVRVEAGIRLRALNARLADAGLGMSNLGSISEQSVAGAISTGTHGTGARFGNLSTQVVSLRMMTADGETHTIDAQRPDLFSAARLSLGALGIITEVTLQCEPAFRLAERATAMPFDVAVERLQDLVDAHEHLKLWWLPHTDKVMAYGFDRSHAAANVGPGTGGALKRISERALATGRREPVDLTAAVEDLLNKVGFDAVLRLGGRVPSLIPAINRAVSALYFQDRERVGVSHHIFNVPMPPVHREMEYGVPRSKAPELLRGVRALIDREGLRVNFIVELRFVAADDLMLSPAYQRDSCQFGAYMAQAPDLDAYFSHFEAMALALGGRPHWGKEFSAPAHTLRAHLPRLDDFSALRDELDPEGRFDNAFLQRIFGAQ